MRTALVTGASGFIGGHLTRTLVECGWNVKCLVREKSRTARLEPLGVPIIRGDLHDADCLRSAVAGSDVVFHLAGLTCALRREELFHVNGEGPRRMAQACQAQETPPVLLLVSSVAAAGPTRGPTPRTEADPPEPVSHYGRSKLEGEQAVRTVAGTVPITVVRPGVVFGENDPGMEPLLSTLYHWRIHVNAGFSSPHLSIINVHDLAQVMIRAAERGERLPAEGEFAAGRGLYFGVTSEYPTYVELGELLAPQLLGSRRHRTLHIPSPIAWMAAGVNEVICRFRRRPDIFNVDKIREALVPSWACSPDKIIGQLEFRPTAPIAQQLSSLAEWWRRQRGDGVRG